MFGKDDKKSCPQDSTPRAEVITFAEARERSRRIRLARAIQEGRYTPDLDQLADALLCHPDLYEE